MSDVGPAADGETDVEAPSNYERLSAHLTPDSLAQALLKSWTESEPGQRQTALVNAVLVLSLEQQRPRGAHPHRCHIHELRCRTLRSLSQPTTT